MKKYHCIVSLLLFFALISCSKDWTDVKVDESQAVPTTPEDFQAMLDDVSTMNIIPSIINGEVASDGHFYTEAVWNALKGTRFQNLYTWTNTIKGFGASEWSLPYATILRLNVVLDGIERYGKRFDPKIIENLKGQVLFQRARIFYDLVQTFSPPFDKTNDLNGLGIPLRLSSDVTIPSVRPSVKDVYEKIIQDLQESERILPESQDFLTRPSRPGAGALLARVYLNMEEYQQAIEAGNRVLSIKDNLVDFNTLSKTANFIGVNTEVLFLSFYSGVSQLTTNYLIDADLYNLYDENDLRKQIYFSKSGELIRFKGTYGNTQSNIFTGLAIDEVYLIRAECYARTGALLAAFKDLNDLLRTRWKKNNGVSTYVDLVPGNETDALKIIFREKRKELIQRNVRWSDLRRLNKDSRFAVVITRTIGGTTFTLEPNSYKYTFPIPNEVIQQANMNQNPGWQ